MMIIFGFYYGVMGTRTANKDFQRKYSKYVGMKGFLNTRLNTFISSGKRTINDLEFFEFPVLLRNCAYYKTPILLPAKIECITQVASIDGKDRGICSLEFDKLVADFKVLYCGQSVLVMESSSYGEVTLIKDPEKNYTIGQIVTLNGIVHQNTFVWTF